MFADRKDAGEKLTIQLDKFKNENVIVLAIPRGGVAVAYASILKYHFNWDIIVPRKIGAPMNKEIAIGAVSSDGSYFLDEKYVKLLNISKHYIEEEVAMQVSEIRRRLTEYKDSPDFPDVNNKTVILIDDGIATGFTILAAARSVKKQGASKVVIATPVAPEETMEKLKSEADEVISLIVPSDFYAVGLYYENFPQVTDREVMELMVELAQ